MADFAPMRNGFRDGTATLRSLGLPGVAGIALLIFALAFAASTLWPLHRQVQSMQDRLAAAPSTASGGTAQGSVVFPTRAELSLLVEETYRLADSQGLAPQRGAYRFADDGDNGLLAYHLELPVGGDYLQIRGFIAGMLERFPTAALDGVSFRRRQEGGVEAHLRFTFYLRP
jgi:hypothetical protein